MTPQRGSNTKLGWYVGIVFTGCFPGFVWGWYNVPTYSGWEGFSHLHIAYGIPFSAGGLTLAVYLALRKAWPRQAALTTSVFAATAIITYYWFRLPPVFGIGDSDAAMIVDISPWLPAWSATALRIFALVAFSWLIVGRTARRAWEKRPPIAELSIADPPSVHPIVAESTNCCGTFHD
jgi:hypothetical protein